MMAKKKNSAPVACGPDEEYMIQEDLRTIQRAQEIAADSKRMANVRKLAAQTMKAVQQIVKTPTPAKAGKPKSAKKK